MLRRLLLGVAAASFILALMGCGESSSTGPQDTTSIKTKDSVDKKGKQQKLMEASVN